MSELFDRNLAILRSRVPETAARVLEAIARGDVPSTVPAATGDPLLELHGRPLDSRRRPREVAEAAAADVTTARVVVLGLGTGYFADALRQRGVALAAVVERASVIAGAIRARDLSDLIEEVPLIALEDLAVPGALARLRAAAPGVVVHTPSAAVTPALQALAERWTALPAARAPRVLVVGPTVGDSTGVADAVERAARQIGCEVRRFDGRQFASAQDAFRTLPVQDGARAGLQEQFMLLLGTANVRLACEWPADLVLAIAQAPLGGPALEALRSAGIRTACWFVENVRVLPSWREVARFYDSFFAIQSGAALDQIAEAGAARIHHLPMACDPGVHTPAVLDDVERQRFGAPVSFAGTPYLNRRHLLEAVRDLGLRVWGDGWESTPLAPCLGEPVRLNPEALRRVFAATRVNLNVHPAAHVTGLDPQPDFVNSRTFELAACGAFQLVDCREPLPALFDPGEVVAFRSAAELRALAEHYLHRPEDAAAIAVRARERVLREHTYAHRVSELLREALPPHLQPGVERPPQESLDDALARAAQAPRLDEEEIELRILADVRDLVEAR